MKLQSVLFKHLSIESQLFPIAKICSRKTPKKRPFAKVNSRKNLELHGILRAVLNIKT